MQSSSSVCRWHKTGRSGRGPCCHSESPWRNYLRGTSSRSARGSVNPATGHQAEHEPAVYSWARRMADAPLACIRQSIFSRSREALLPLYLALVRSNLDCFVQFLLPQNKTDLYQRESDKLPLGWWQDRSICVLRNGWDSGTGCSYMEKRRLGGDPNAVYKFLKGGSAEDGARLF